MNVILLNLVASDFSVSVLGNPFTLISALNHGWFFGDAVCVAYGFFMSLLGEKLKLILIMFQADKSIKLEAFFEKFGFKIYSNRSLMIYLFIHI